MTEDEMVGWHHQRNRHDSVWAPGAGDGQGSLVSLLQGIVLLSDTTE